MRLDATMVWSCFSLCRNNLNWLAAPGMSLSSSTAFLSAASMASVICCSESSIPLAFQCGFVSLHCGHSTISHCWHAHILFPRFFTIWHSQHTPTRFETWCLTSHDCPHGHSLDLADGWLGLVWVPLTWLAGSSSSCAGRQMSATSSTGRSAAFPCLMSFSLCLRSRACRLGLGLHFRCFHRRLLGLARCCRGSAPLARSALCFAGALPGLQVQPYTAARLSMNTRR